MTELPAALRLPPDVPCALFRCRVRPHPRFFELSPTVANVTGYPEAEFRRRPLLYLRLLEGRDRPRLLEVLADPAAQHASLTHRLRHRDGSLRWVELRLTVDRDEAGRAVGVEGLVRDVTGRLRAEEALRASEEKYRLFVENALEGICVCQGDRVRYANPEFVALTGYTLEEVLAQSLLRIVHPDDHALVIDQYRRRMLGENPASHYEFRGVTRSGEIRWLTMSAVRIEWEGQPAALDFVSDITERVRAEQELVAAHGALEERVRERTAELETALGRIEADVAARERSEREKGLLEGRLRRGQTLEAVGRLAGGVAHDFNNLLGGVLGCLYLARLELPAGSPAAPELDRAQQLCRQGGDLTRKLLDVARQRPGRVEAVEVGGLLGDAEALLLRALPRDVRLLVEAEPGLPGVLADRSTLTSAFLNLGLNARDAMPAGGTLSVRARRGGRDEGGEAVVIEVADTGEGIPEELHERIFEPFFTTKAPGEGSGLGLSMVYAGIRECGGDVAVRSNPERGVTFSIRLPAAEPARAGSAPTGRAAVHPVSAGPILVVEDEPDLARLAAAVLGQAGYRTLAAANGLEALEVIRAKRAELGLIALDLLLPELGGAEVYRLLRALAPELPVLFVTGRPDLARLADPSVPVVAKPFTPEELLAAVAARLGGGAAPLPK